MMMLLSWSSQFNNKRRNEHDNIDINMLLILRYVNMV